MFIRSILNLVLSTSNINVKFISREQLMKCNRTWAFKLVTAVQLSANKIMNLNNIMRVEKFTLFLLD